MGVFHLVPRCPYTPTDGVASSTSLGRVTSSAVIPMGMCWAIPGRRNLPRLWAQPSGAHRSHRIPLQNVGTQEFRTLTVEMKDGSEYRPHA